MACQIYLNLFNLIPPTLLEAGYKLSLFYRVKRLLA